MALFGSMSEAMKFRAALFALMIAAPASAQDDPLSILEGLSRSAREALEAMGALTGAWAEGLSPVLSDPDAYDPPEILPNGDILIRRRPEPEAPDPAPEQPPAPDGDAVDL
jgi:hypothetical protein